MDISIIIVNKDTQDFLKTCLESLANENIDFDIEIYVVDNASRDGSVAMVRERFPDVKLITNITNSGFAKANNQAVVEAKGRFIFLLNPDAFIRRGSLLELYKTMEARKELGISGPAIFNPDGSRQPSWGRFPALWLEFFYQTYLFKLLPLPFPYTRYVHPFMSRIYERFQCVDWVTGAAMMIRKDVIAKIGVLSEDLFMYGEDLDFCHRARQAGFEIAYNPSAEVVHHVRGSRTDFENWIVHITLGILKFYEEKATEFELRIAGGLVWGGSLFRYLAWAIIGQLWKTRAVEARQRCRGYLRAMAIGRERFISRRTRSEK